MAVITSKQIAVPSTINYVEYIESSGTQYIDTGHVATANTVLVADMKVNDLSTTRNICGATDVVYLFNSSTSTNAIECYFGNDHFGVQTSTPITERFTLEIGASGIKVNGATLRVPSYTSFNNSTNILFMTRQGGHASARGHITLYGLKLYESGTLIRDFWPCYDPDGVACLYDKVSGTYYYNAGSGSFTAGGAV